MDKMANYNCYYNSAQKYIVAGSLYEAKTKAISEFKVPKSKQGLVAVVFIGYVDGPAIAVDTASL